MRLLGIAGHSGMGKTTLLERLVPSLTARGLAVSLIKHSHKSIQIDQPGKDSWRLREAGCKEVLLLGNERWALMHELRSSEEPPLDELVARLHRVDLVLIEGFKQGRFPKLEVWRAAVGKPPLWQPGSDIVAVASDDPWPAAGTPPPRRLPLADLAALTDCVLDGAVATGSRAAP